MFMRSIHSDSNVPRFNHPQQDAIPELPSADIAQGVLPRLIATLVGRRRQVKSLMKERNISPAKLLQVRHLLSVRACNPLILF